MNKYLESCLAWMQAIRDTARAEPNPHRRAILENYVEHVALEYCGRAPEILSTVRTVEHPIYHVQLGTDETITYDGADAIANFYGNLDVVVNQDERLAVADWGFASHSVINIFTPGASLKKQQIAIDDPDATYLVSVPIAMFWNYDAKARLIGEDIWETGQRTVAKLKPSEVVTFEQRAEVAAPFLPS
jgi:hypothetical protein